MQAGLTLFGSKVQATGEIKFKKTKTKSSRRSLNRTHLNHHVVHYIVSPSKSKSPHRSLHRTPTGKVNLRKSLDWILTGESNVTNLRPWKYALFLGNVQRLWNPQARPLVAAFSCFGIAAPQKRLPGIIGSSATGKVIRKPAQTTAVLHPYPEFRSPMPTSTVSWSHKTGDFTWAQDIICYKIDSIKLPSWQDSNLCIFQW